ncbi:MAG TPA: YARHG domain-containing protein [Cytophagales bacterium]|nr:YARHG domain-containing protein [Cytophagales bacterium]
MKHLITILFLLLYSTCFSQYFQDNRIEDESRIAPWIAGNIEEYEGVYFFGISEYETKAILSIDSGLVNFQISNAGNEIYINGQFAGWEQNIENYTNVRIDGNKFYSNQTYGEFVTYNINGKEVKCLKLNSPPKDVYDGDFELGTFSSKNKTNYVSGIHPNTKFDVSSLTELRKYGLDELRVMRNEIFARYGYIFTEGGQMGEYFKNQTWYAPRVNNISELVTEIEKKNIQNIRLIEKEKSL